MPVYHPREPADSSLWKTLHNHYEDFKAGYGEHCEKQYGFFRPVVDEVVEEYLRCGDSREGFARVRRANPECEHEHLLAFSCKGRRFCPSCHSKKTIRFADDVTHNILYPVPHRQFVFSIPIMLRIYFKYDRKLPTKLRHCAKEGLETFFRTVSGLDDGVLGMITVIHTFGDHAGFHPHLHAIVADGLFRPNGTFHRLPKNVAPDSLHDGDIPSKIETKMCLTHLTIPATQKPSKAISYHPVHRRGIFSCSCVSSFGQRLRIICYFRHRQQKRSKRNESKYRATVSI